MSMVTWDVAAGFSNPEKGRGGKYLNPHVALRAIVDTSNELFRADDNHVFVFRDLDDFMMDPTVRRLIRTMCESNQLVNPSRRRPLVIVSPVRKIHERVKSCLTLLEFELPGEAQLRETLKFVQRSIATETPERAALDEELSDQIVQCLRGLTSTEAENALSRCVTRHRGFKPEMLTTIKDEKASIIRKSEVLTYIPETQQAKREDIGGFGQLLTFVDRRKQAYSRKAQENQIDFPKGVVLIGLPGTGKSYVAAAVARLLGLPGYVLDIGSVFGSLVGESEQRMRDAIRQIEAQQGCVLLLDEADKAFGGVTDGANDSGVSRRVFGQLLTWLAAKNDKTFVIMTLNRTTGIPPEFLRAGRFDAVFWTDLPNATERRAIFDIHMKKRGVVGDSLHFTEDDYAAIIAATEGYVGAEIEQIVKEARYLSWERAEAAVPTLEEVLQAARATVPLSRLEKEKVEEIRLWCRDRAMNVSEPEKVTGRSRSRTVDIDAA
jgi:SpoVK/Ycf46/Vps4 family AAA+-type ATPase